MSSATQTPLHGGATSAPPPTPSSQPASLLSTAAAADTLTHLLHRLPPSLSLPPTTTKSPQPATCPSLTGDSFLLPNNNLGFFQLAADHALAIPSRLAHSAESEALSLFDLSRDQKETRFPRNFPFGYDHEAESFCVDAAAESVLPSLGELTRELERVGLRIAEELLGFENDQVGLCTLTWLSEEGSEKMEMTSGGLYPYLVGLQYQIRARKCSLWADSGRVTAQPELDSILVTIGDIAQVWSNGKLKKVRGRPTAWSENNSNDSRRVSITVLITLPLDSDTVVGPLVLGNTPQPKHQSREEGSLEMINEEEEDDDGSDDTRKKREESLFNSFSFEDYAWRVYHDRLSLKDPLDRHRIRV